jgi:hypothetical protein
MGRLKKGLFVAAGFVVAAMVLSLMNPRSAIGQQIREFLVVNPASNPVNAALVSDTRGFTHVGQEAREHVTLINKQQTGFWGYFDRVHPDGTVEPSSTSRGFVVPDGHVLVLTDLSFAAGTSAGQSLVVTIYNGPEGTSAGSLPIIVSQGVANADNSVSGQTHLTSGAVVGSGRVLSGTKTNGRTLLHGYLVRDQ